MKTMKEFWKELCQRWHNHMPVFFRRIFKICALISGTAGAAHTAMTSFGIQPHEWWIDIVPYLIAFPAGIAFACMFTQQYSGKPINYEDYRRAERTGRTVLDRDIDHMHGTPPQPQCPTVSPSEQEPHEIEPYDDRPDA